MSCLPRDRSPPCCTPELQEPGVGSAPRPEIGEQTGTHPSAQGGDPHYRDFILYLEVTLFSNFLGTESIAPSNTDGRLIIGMAGDFCGSEAGPVRRVFLDCEKGD